MKYHDPALIQSALNFKKIFRDSDDDWKKTFDSLMECKTYKAAQICFSQRIMDLCEIREIFPFFEEECNEYIAETERYYWAAFTDIEFEIEYEKENQ